ncbi:hypothetical protein FRACYDRAFT_246549 [Fragilariopsis cylindrus CCMP1102]|uniref:Uncharacterized protein n=1 Tax=Fragilariopsis cylindrus CCMP1102 TaxID=635003 RepID=A0A1E7EXH4_9STRA|nr:hypothetical protein FRACYDRAFT_246549 [Fragilariopsis cylindrus CCMP1102]|eukprot:OEU10738.1 hypothetical protein FRACYDRAFT_246549 [Fragilariopsis cylindrus CCMP1102]
MSATTTARLSSAIYRMSSCKIGVVPRQKIIRQFQRQRQQQQQQCCSSWLMRNSSSRHLTTTTASSTTTTTTKNNISSSSSSSSKPSSLFSKEQYVHPLSQIVLTHLQQSQSDFLKQYGLVENSLTFHKDGTFTLAFPSSNTTTIPNTTTTNNSNSNTTDTQQQESNNNKNKNMIWTWYEAAEKKHWLSIERNEVVGSYLMQDNLKSAWSSDTNYDKIIDATNTMVQKVLTENK